MPVVYNIRTANRYIHDLHTPCLQKDEALRGTCRISQRPNFPPNQINQSINSVCSIQIYWAPPGLTSTCIQSPWSTLPSTVFLLSPEHSPLPPHPSQYRLIATRLSPHHAAILRGSETTDRAVCELHSSKGYSSCQGEIPAFCQPSCVLVVWCIVVSREHVNSISVLTFVVLEICKMECSRGH